MKTDTISKDYNVYKMKTKIIPEMTTETQI